MPIAGGTSDKLGNRYEILWAIDQLLNIVDGTGTELTLEPIEPDESRGIEFRVRKTDGTTEYWSVKRQLTGAAGWTLSKLADKDANGRSILNDLQSHVQRNKANHAVFASALGAPTLAELSEYAADQSVFQHRLAKSKALNGEFNECVLPICGSLASAIDFLRRITSRAIDHAQLQTRIDFAIRKLFFRLDRSSLDPGGVREHLAELLHGHFHQPIGRSEIMLALRAQQIGLRDWASDPDIQTRVASLCDNYINSIASGYINGTLLHVPSDGALLGSHGRAASSKVLVIGTAGGGKSCLLASTVRQLRNAGTPVLAFRFDQVAEGTVTTLALGRMLGLPESPAITLAGLAQGSACTLVVDQMDAVSVVSGRRIELWSLFEALLQEAARHPQMSVIVGCRAFDLEHDHRLRSLSRDKSGFSKVTLKPLLQDQIDDAIKAGGGDARAIPDSLKRILETPLHLSMFLSLGSTTATTVQTRDQLFDSFWATKRQKVDARRQSHAKWTETLDLLVGWLSDHQDLSAPKPVLDAFAPDADAMVSEHVLVLANDRYGFFHESFFDYAFARRLAATGTPLLGMLRSGEQHLFRRGQVRQALTYLREHDWPRYLTELEDLLTASDVRFHIKRLIFYVLAVLTEPRPEEWQILKRVLQADLTLRTHVLSVVAGHPIWFDILDTSQFFDEALSATDEARANEVIWIFGRPDTLDGRSARVAALLAQHRKATETWRNYLRHVCRGGGVYHSQAMFDLFIDLIDDGTLDGVRPGFAVNDDWWMVLYSMSKDKPEYACKAIGHWFDRVVVLWDHSDNGSSLRDRFDKDHHGALVLQQAATGAPGAFAMEMLPRIAQLVSDVAASRASELDIDPVWYVRWYGDDTHSTVDALLVRLAQALETMAREQPAILDQLLAPYVGSGLNTVNYLLLRAWSAAPETYAERLGRYLADDQRRLKIGYSAWGVDGGSAANHTSSNAIRISSSRCVEDTFHALESTVLTLRDDWENKNPQIRGRIQYELLAAMDQSRLSIRASGRLDELRRKFPRVTHELPKMSAVVNVGSPIDENAHAKMSDEHWLKAMTKYAGTTDRHVRPISRSGGMHQLAQALGACAKAEPSRFVALATRMTDDLPGDYVDAIIHGVVETVPHGSSASFPITVAEASSLIHRAHAMPTRPCGRSIAWMVRKWHEMAWPDSVIDAVAWYATNDPDPGAGAERGTSGRDLLMAGINSTRGAAADAVASLLFADGLRLVRLRPAIEGLVHDDSQAVRSCAIESLLAMLSIDQTTAIEWFRDCVEADDDILATHYVSHFIRYAANRDYAGLQSVIRRMLKANDQKIVSHAAVLVCLLAFDVDAAKADAILVRSGNNAMRKGAAEVYAANVAHESVGAEARSLLKPFFGDEDESVRTEAASAFGKTSRMASTSQAELLEAFLDASPGSTALEPVIRALEDSPIQLPDLVCRLLEQGIEAFRDGASNIATGSAMVAHDLSKIVVRLYSQSGETHIRSRCLDVIDKMERDRFYGMTDELRLMDR